MLKKKFLENKFLEKKFWKKKFWKKKCIGPIIRIGQEIRCLPYAGFFLKNLCCKKKKLSNHFFKKILNFFLKDKSCNLSKIVLVLQSASVERFDVSRMRDFYITVNIGSCTLKSL